jgi:arsenite-transporting ATPase
MMLSDKAVELLGRRFDWVGVGTRFVLFTGKGGVGKTTVASVTAVALADAGRQVLLVSTDPAVRRGDRAGGEAGRRVHGGSGRVRHVRPSAGRSAVDRRV